MTPDQLRALADALRKMRWHLMSIDDACDLEHAADYLLACADEQPVAWRYEVRGTAPTTEWKQYGVYVTERAARNHASLAGSGIEGRVVPLFTHPAPAAPQAEPKREPLSDDEASVHFKSGFEHGERAAYERAAQECEKRAGPIEIYNRAYPHYLECADAIRALGEQHD